MLEILVKVFILYSLFYIANKGLKKWGFGIHLAVIILLLASTWMNHRSDIELKDSIDDLKELIKSPETVQKINDYNKEPTIEKWATVVQSIERTKALEEDIDIKIIDAFIKRLQKLGLLLPPPPGLETTPD